MSADDDTDGDEPAGPATQIGLICAILTYLDRKNGGVIDLNNTVGVGLANAVLAAANAVITELRRSPPPTADG